MSHTEVPPLSSGGHPFEVPTDPRPRAWLVGLAGGVAAALLGSAGLISHTVLGIALFVVQAGLGLAWLTAIGAPGRLGGALITAGAAGGADLILINRQHQPAGGLMGVMGLALVAGLLHQLMRRPRPHVTSSLAAEISGAAILISFACLAGLQSSSVGESALVVWMTALAFGLPVGRLVDSKLPYLLLGKDNRRGLLGLIVGIGVAVLAGGIVGSKHPDLGTSHGEILAAVTAFAAYVADTVVVRTSADLDPRDDRRITAIRPLAALLPLAIAAPATYVVGRILLG